MRNLLRVIPLALLTFVGCVISTNEVLAVVAAEGQQCAVSTNSGASAAEISRVTSAISQYTSRGISITVEEFTCQNTASFSATQKGTCFSGMCDGVAAVKCCPTPEAYQRISAATNPTGGAQTPTGSPTTAPTADAAATGDGCGTATTLTPEQTTAVTAAATAMSSTPANMACRNVRNLPRAQKSRACVSNLCLGYSSTYVMCCAGGVGSAPGEPDRTTGGTGTTGETTGGIGRLALPGCISDGNCGLDDIVKMAVNFSNFLFGISGAIFLLIFVISGFKLIFFATDAGGVKAAKDSLVKAGTGMAIIALAGVGTTYLYNNLRGRSTSGTEGRGNTCAEEVPATATSPAYACQTVSDIPDKSDYEAYSTALRSLNCRPSNDDTTNLCPRVNQYCCPPGVANRYIPPQQ